MWPIATDGVAWSVCGSIPAKAADAIVMPFGIWTRVGPRNHVAPIRWGLDPHTQRGNFEGEKGQPKTCLTCPAIDIIKATQQCQNRYGADADWGVLDRVTLVPNSECN